jgi:cytochrome c5
MGWTGAFASSAPQEAVRLAGAEQLTRPFVMDGADLYRVSCRACHKADGSGAPPEINSLIGPVRSASVEWQTQRMKELGRPVDAAMTRQVAAETEADLRKRLKVGGHSMPAFGHLSDDEIVVLRVYLDKLAGLPGGENRQRYLTVPVARVGELIAKGTCHICHDASGGAPSVQTTVLSGIIPSLASIPHQKTIYDFVQKVTKGMPIPLSASGVSSRGRMPVFTYFTEREAGAAYLYLIMYPPT